MRKLTLLASLLFLAQLAGPAHAYIGPGAGVGTIAVVFGVIASVFLALVAILWYPLKRVYRAISASLAKRTKVQADLK